MGSFLTADRNEPVNFEVNRTTKKFIEYYVSALESLHYISLEFNRMDYEDSEKERMEKAKVNKYLTSKESEKVRKMAYDKIKLEDMFKPNKWSTGFMDLFDDVKLPYFDNQGILRHSSPNSLLKGFYESLYSSSGYIKFGFADRTEETMIVKGNALSKRNKAKADYSNRFIREELERLTDKMMEYFLSRTALLYYKYPKPLPSDGSNASREYFSIFSKMKIPLLELVLVDAGKSFEDSTYEIKKQYIKFGDAIDKKISELGYSSYVLSDEDDEIRSLNWLVWINFARQTLQKTQ